MAASDPWFHQYATTREDPRLVKLARLLGVTLAEAVGCVLLLKCWAVDKRPDGVLDGCDELDVEVHAKWEGEPGAFTRAALAVGVLGQSLDGIALNQEEWLKKEAGSYKEAQKKAAQRARKRGPSADSPGTEAPSDEDVPGQSGDSRGSVAGPENRESRVEIKDPTPPTATNDTRCAGVSRDSPETGGGGPGVRFASKKQLDAALTVLMRKPTTTSRIGWEAFKRIEPSEDELAAATEETRDSDPERIGDPGGFLMGTIERMRREARLPKRVGTPRGYHPGTTEHEAGDGRL